MKRAIVFSVFLFACAQSVAPDLGPIDPPVTIAVSFEGKLVSSRCRFTFAVTARPTAVLIAYEIGRAGRVWTAGSFRAVLEESWILVGQNDDAIEYLFTVGAWSNKGEVGASC